MGGKCIRTYAFMKYLSDEMHIQGNYLERIQTLYNEQNELNLKIQELRRTLLKSDQVMQEHIYKAHTVMCVVSEQLPLKPLNDGITYVEDVQLDSKLEFLEENIKLLQSENCSLNTKNETALIEEEIENFLASINNIIVDIADHLSFSFCH